ncbi:hypothetical protein [Burkholderia ubonensis]|uniref:hypothetical protein n=1 Tax=Burkholderia ubonensis TaxID=101571 RepID=UPI000759F864|nr:hypothetical protein [Burkholderia ubonensis]KVG73895.1 hypothetical protein WJ34_14585 [Burkholderia ubonensis]KVH23389.1 hypothetical protein WJ37_11740 [Burkholderia ubonensis]KVH42616.1 hypothetical protein WJ38_01585 [Burkholderia ubonensis]KVH80908.1 hypothetical protein WJ43_30720 [Burkholderia ubonensis]KVM26118.1 hypothetical protein WJ55_29260 [Burkholderia ubonensis]
MHTGASASIHDMSASRGTGDGERRSDAKSTIDLATFMVRPVTSCDGETACLPLRGKPLDATAPAFAIAVRSV